MTMRGGEGDKAGSEMGKRNAHTCISIHVVVPHAIVGHHTDFATKGIEKRPVLFSSM